jgi:hypothetical protein
MRKRWAVALAVVAALLVTAGALAMSPTDRNAMARARADAARQIAAVRFPRAATKVRDDPSVRGLRLVGRFCVKSYTAWDHGFWRVPGSLESVFGWMQKNPPLHTHGFDASRSTNVTKSSVWDITVPFKDQTNVHGQMVDIQLGFARGGGTAVRVDLEAFVSPPRKLIPKRCQIGSY